MDCLWLVKGDYEAPGWRALRDASKSEEVDVIHLDPQVWAIVQAAEAPSGYEGLTSAPPPDGLYLDPHGRPLYIVDGHLVDGPRDVIRALGPEAESLLAKIGDPDTVLERLGRAF